MPNDKDYKLVYVEWADSFVGTSGWGEVEGARPSVVTCQSVGWLVYDGKDCKLIVPHLNEADHPDVSRQGCGDVTIPASAIVRMVELDLTKLARKKRGG